MPAPAMGSAAVEYATTESAAMNVAVESTAVMMKEAASDANHHWEAIPVIGIIACITFG